MSKGPPIPVRFEDAETNALVHLATKTGLSMAELIRRSVRLFYAESQKSGTGSIIEKTATPLRIYIDAFAGPSVAEDSAPFQPGQPTRQPVRYTKPKRKKSAG